MHDILASGSSDCTLCRSSPSLRENYAISRGVTASRLHLTCIQIVLIRISVRSPSPENCYARSFCDRNKCITAHRTRSRWNRSLLRTFSSSRAINNSESCQYDKRPHSSRSGKIEKDRFVNSLSSFRYNFYGKGWQASYSRFINYEECILVSQYICSIGHHV